MAFDLGPTVVSTPLQLLTFVIAIVALVFAIAAVMQIRLLPIEMNRLRRQTDWLARQSTPPPPSRASPFSDSGVTVK